ncbi:unnamed protein product [Ostreobium quekettii]|uniref:PROP1-like PPR domain-containing protein n=1 Tax=Ostreobium quekettii TaxID=121088 RepID=A0A8S1J559_9CHLO|nr:unnamed protein product [Ostreobium quekettii]|eukprot:evm.model.scf_256EXC.1 EVM.evm.TU.scf_256EXC.1   scf_256EXC:5051-7351(+)
MCDAILATAAAAFGEAAPPAPPKGCADEPDPKGLVARAGVHEWRPCGQGAERVQNGGECGKRGVRKAAPARPPSIQLPRAMSTPELESPNGPLELCAREDEGEDAIAGIGQGMPTEKPAWDMDTMKRAVAGARTGAGEVARVVETCTFKPREQAFTALINMCGQARDWRKAVEVFEAMKAARGVRPNTYTYSALIAACSNAGEWQRALEFFEVMKAAAVGDPGCAPNEVTYSALITACERGGVFGKALEAYDAMLAAGIPGDHISFSSALSACEKSGNMDRAKEILQEMHKRGFVASLGIYKEIMLDYAENGDWDRALDMCLTMQMVGQDPSEGARKRRGKKKPSQPAPAPQAEHQPQGSPQHAGVLIPRPSPAERESSGTKSPIAKPAWDMETLKRAIVLARLGTGEVRRVIEGCQFKPREQAFTALINLCGRLRDWKKAVEVFEAMKAARGVRPNTYTYSALIAACSSAGEWQKALEVFEAMKAAARGDANCRPNEVTYSALITACQRGGMFDRALELYDETIRAGVAPDQITFSSALAACEKSERWDKAGRILEDMHARGLTGSPNVYCELIHSHADNGEWRSALDVFMAMQRAGAQPDANTCKALMKALERGPQPELALELYNSMRQSAIPIDTDVYSMAVRAAVQVDAKRAGGGMVASAPTHVVQVGMSYPQQLHLPSLAPRQLQVASAPKLEGPHMGLGVPQFEQKRGGSSGFALGQALQPGGLPFAPLHLQYGLDLGQQQAYSKMSYVARMANLSLRHQ